MQLHDVGTFGPDDGADVGTTSARRENVVVARGSILQHPPVQRVRDSASGSAQQTNARRKGVLYAGDGKRNAEARLYAARQQPFMNASRSNPCAGLAVQCAEVEDLQPITPGLGVALGDGDILLKAGGAVGLIQPRLKK